MEDAVEGERQVKEEKRLSTLFSNQSRSVNGYIMLMAFMAISLKRDSQHCCLFSLVTLYCSGLREHKVCKGLCFIGAEVLP